MSAELAAAYRDLRGRILERTAGLSPEEAERTVPCCPEWSVRDLLCHLAGVPADILTGNTDGAATVPWADSHVTRRAGWDVARILDELDDAGNQVDEIVTAFGRGMPGPFFLDAWTHEADLAHALGYPGPSDLRLVDHVLDFLIDSVDRRLTKAALGPLVLRGLGPDRVVGARVPPDEAGDHQGPTSDLAELRTNRFEFARATMGRRSLAQLAALDWQGIDGAVAGPLLVAWTPNEVDIIEVEPRIH
ncbi:MAG: maleylpyruvate isomerase N-terminal domain-containing protein [Acidimicrobiales bacterium]